MEDASNAERQAITPETEPLEIQTEKRIGARAIMNIGDNIELGYD
jgi:hypothetical protein